MHTFTCIQIYQAYQVYQTGPVVTRCAQCNAPSCCIVRTDKNAEQPAQQGSINELIRHRHGLQVCGGISLDSMYA